MFPALPHTGLTDYVCLGCHTGIRFLLYLTALSLKYAAHKNEEIGI